MQQLKDFAKQLKAAEKRLPVWYHSKNI
jgi:hypothetical protein